MLSTHDLADQVIPDAKPSVYSLSLAVITGTLKMRERKTHQQNYRERKLGQRRPLNYKCVTTTRYVDYVFINVCRLSFRKMTENPARTFTHGSHKPCNIETVCTEHVCMRSRLSLPHSNVILCIYSLDLTDPIIPVGHRVASACWSTSQQVALATEF